MILIRMVDLTRTLGLGKSAAIPNDRE